MTSTEESFSKEPYSVTNKNTPNEINHNFSSQCNKENTKHSAEQISLSTSKKFTPSVRMYLRIRPSMGTEGRDVYCILNPTTLLTKFPSFEDKCQNPRSAKSSEAIGRRHTFTKIFGSETSQAEIFQQSIKYRVEDFLHGKSSTIMTYGTRHSGKTYTLFGTSESPGIIPRSIDLVFSVIGYMDLPLFKLVDWNEVYYYDRDESMDSNFRRKYKMLKSFDIHNQISTEAEKSLENSRLDNTYKKCNSESMYAVWLSFVEIYNENIYDLLDDSKQQCPLRLVTKMEGQTYICKSQKVYANTALEACKIFLTGQLKAKTLSISPNFRNSRSHTIFTMTLLKYHKKCLPKEVVISTLTFYDSTSLIENEVPEEILNMQKENSINNSLLVLDRCLKAMSQNQVAPFDESTLTRMSQCALSGKENLSLIMNVIFPSNIYAEVQNTLNFCITAGKLETFHKTCKQSCGFEGTISSSEACDNDVITSSSVHQTLSETAETIDYIDSAAYKSIQEQNKKLIKELEIIKSAIINREYTIQQELADHYSYMIEELKAPYRENTKEMETEEHDLLKWSIRHVKNFYKKRFDNLIRHKKRKRGDDCEYIKDNHTFYAELENENVQVISKIVVLKEVMKKLRKENRVILSEKNKCSFELALIMEELKKFRQLTRALIRKWDDNSENIEDDANCLMNNLERLMDEKVRRTEMKLEEMKEKDADAASKVMTVKQELSESEDLLNNTLIKMRKLEEELSRKEAYAATLKHHDPTLLATQTYVESTKKKSVNISDIDHKSLFGNSGSMDCSVSRSSDKSSKYDSGMCSGLQNESQRSTSVSDSTYIHENDAKCTQTYPVEKDSDITVEESVEQLKIDRIDLKRQNHEEMLHVAELSQGLKIIRNMIYTLNEAVCTNECKIIQHDYFQLFQKETLEQLTEEEKEIVTKGNDLFMMIENKMQEYKREISELTRKLEVKEENEDRAFKCLEKFIETKFVESKLSLMHYQLNREFNKCTNEMPRIESLEEEVLRKTLQINVLKEKIAQMQDKFAKGYELLKKVQNDFEIIVNRWQRDKNELCRQLCECSETQLSLENKLKKLTIRAEKRAEKKGEVISSSSSHLKTEVRDITDEKAKNLSKQVTEAGQNINSAKEDLQCCENLYENMENVTKAGTDDFRSLSSDCKNNIDFLSKICTFYDDSLNEINCLKYLLEYKELEVTRLKRQLQCKELEIVLHKNNRDTTIQKCEVLIRRLQNEIEEKNEHFKTVSNGLNNLGRSLTENNAECEILDFLKKFSLTKNQGQSEKSLKVHETKCSLANSCLVPECIGSEALNVSSALDSTTSFDEKDGTSIKFDYIESCQVDNSVRCNHVYTLCTSCNPKYVHPVYKSCEVDSSEIEFDFNMRSDTNDKKELNWMEVRRTHGKTAFSQLSKDKCTDINSDSETE